MRRLCVVTVTGVLLWSSRRRSRGNRRTADRFSHHHEARGALTRTRGLP